MTTFQKIIIPLVVLLLAGWFYWFQYRPSQIKQECTHLVKEKSQENDWSLETLNAGYEYCLHAKGL